MPERQDKTFSDWSMRVMEELVTLTKQGEVLEKNLDRRCDDLAKDIEDKYNLVSEGVDERYKHMERKLDKMNQVLAGNGDPSKGLIVRVDRLEQNETRRTWLMRAVMTASIGCILSLIMFWVKH